nr:PqqD family peptide modification chaperone [uncultured Draconibacterium sp.]
MEKYYRNQQIIDGELDNNQVMMHIEKGKYFGLNPVGKRIWELINEPKTFSEITDQLLTEFDVEEDVCKQEVEEFLKKAKDADLVKIA